MTHDGDDPQCRSWWACRWWPDRAYGLTDDEVEHHVLELVGAGWELTEAIAAAGGPSWWPADDPSDLASGAAS